MKQLLLNREWHVNGTWYAPQEFIEQKYKSVVYADYLETTSSAGDWSGYILQKIFGTYYITLFWQKNAYPDKGFDVETNSDYLIAFGGDEPSKRECEEIIWEVENF